MSTTIDSKVVEMRFDNKHFESNVSTTMSTLDKLKQKLHLDGATKGLENVGSAVKKVDFTPLSTAAETVQAKFSAMQVMAVTALANITNSAVNAGKRMVAALTIDPVRTGFSEYELKLDSVKTIMASTGEDVKVVNKYLGELNEYSDQTIYSFADMTQNIGKFTNAGVKLEDAVAAIKGISNEAALSGANANEASRAMYNFAQALSSGYVKLIDWKSIENANMATVQFKEELIKTALEMGTVTKAGDGMYKTLEGHAFNATKNFNDVLQDQWMTSNVLVTTLRKYADETTDIGKRAKAAATEVTKVSQIFDILKETAQSGWAQTWELIIGDIDTAKKILTPINDALSGFIDMISDWRNRILQIALDLATPWKAIEEKISKITGKIDKVVSGVTGTLEYFQDVVDRVWMGDFNNWGDNPDRRDLLRQAGYDPRVVQYLVNLGEEAWHSGKVYKLSMEEVEAAHKKYGLTVKTTKEETEEVTEAFNGLSDEMLESAGLTEDEIRLYRALEKEANKLGISVSELAEDMSKNNGRDLLIKSFKNIGRAIMQVADICKTAYVEIFNPPSVEEIGIGLYGLIRRFKDFTDSLTLVDKKTKKLTANGEKVKDIFKGVFALIDIIVTLSAGPLRIVFNVLTQLLGIFGYTLFDAAAALGRLIVKFRDGFDGVVNFTKIIEKMAPYIKAVAEAIRDWAIAMDFKGKLEKVTGRIDGLVESFKAWIETLKDSKNLPQDIAKGIMSGMGKLYGYIKSIFSKIWSYVTGGFSDASDYVISGFVNGIWNGMKIAGQVMVELGKLILAKFEEVLGIESPSKEAQKDGEFFMIGFLNGIKDYVLTVLGYIKNFGLKCIETLSKLDLGTIFAGLLAAGIVRAFNKIAEAFGAFGGIGDGVEDVLEQAAKTLKSFKTMVKSMALENTARALKEFAIAVAILVGAVIVLGYVCGQDKFKIWEAVGVIGALAVILFALAAATSFISKSSVEIGKSGAKIDNLTSGLISIGLALLIVAFTVKLIGSMEPEAAKAGFEGLQNIIAGIVGILLACKVFVTGDLAGNMDKVGQTMLKISIAMLLIVFVAKLIAGMKWNEMGKAAIGLVGLVGIVTLLILVTKLAGPNADKIGGTILKVAAAMAVLTYVAKTIAGMSWADMGKAAAGLSGLVGIVAGLMAATRLAGGNSTKIGSTILGIAAAMLILTYVIKLISKMSADELVKGIAVIEAFSLIISGLIYATRYGGKDADKAGKAILGVAAAIAVLALVAIILGVIKIETLAQGLVAIGIMALMVSLMISACRGVDDIKNNLIVLTVAIGILALAIAGLSFIDPKRLGAAAGAMSAVTLVFAILIQSTKNLEKVDVKKLALPLLALLGVMAILAGIVILLSTIKNPEPLIPAAIALGILMLAMTVAAAALGVISKVAKKALPGVLALTLMIIPLLGLVFVLSKLSGVDVAMSNVAALCILATVSVILLALLVPIGSLVTQALLGVLALTLMAVPLLAFVGVLAVMQNVEVAAGKVAALILLAVVMTALLYLLIPIGALWIPAAIGILALTATAVPMMAFVGVLAVMQGIENAAANTELLISLMTSMAAVLVAIALAGPMALIGVTALTALMSLMVVMGLFVAAVCGLLEVCPDLAEFVDNAIPILVKLAGGMGQMIGTFVSNLLGTMLTGLPTIGLLLSQFMVNALPFITLSRLVDNQVLAGVGIMTAAIIALTVADLINGIAAFMSGGTSFAGLGAELSLFMLNALPFILYSKLVDPAALEGVKTIAEMVLILTAADILEGLTSWFTGGNSLASFGEQLPDLGTNLKAFADNLGEFDDTKVATVTCAANALKTIADAASSLPNEGGLLADIMGDNGIGGFAKQLPDVGTQIKDFANNLGEFDKTKLDTVTNGADALTAIATAAKEIPNDGGLLGKIMGENGIGGFVKQLPDVGTNIAKFAKNLTDGGFTSDSQKVVERAMDSLEYVASTAKEIPNDGGWIGDVLGENTIGVFVGQLPDVGADLCEFAKKLGEGFGETQQSSVTSAMTTLQNIANVAKELPSDGGWIGKLFGGDDSLGTFGDKLPALGEDLKGFSDAVVGIAIQSVYAASQALKTIADATIVIPEDTSRLKTFGTNIVGLSDKLVSYFSAAGGIDSGVRDSARSAIIDVASVQTMINPGVMQTASNAISNLVNSMKKVAEIENSTGDALKNAVNNIASADFGNLGKDVIADFIKGMDSLRVSAVTTAAGMMADIIVDIRDTKDYPGRFKSLGEKFALKIAEGIEAYADRAKIKVTSMISKTLTYVRDDLDYPGRYKSLGASCVSGFVAGIDENTFRAEAKAAAMAAAALTAAKNALAVNSPSKKFRDLGMSVPEGFALGIDKMGSVVNGSATSMATGAIDTVKKAIGRVSDMVSTDIDTQPTIRPVLDLSDVRSGASALSGMLDMNSSVGVQANIGAISSMMNLRGQNGANDDVVAALDSLNKKMDNIGNTTYNVNGVTYDDGSNIATAMTTIARAALKERRM